MDAGCAPEETSEELDGSQRDLERVYLGLRTIEGIPPQWVNNPGFVAKMAKNGWLEVNRERIALSPSGWLRMDQIILGLTTYAEGG